MKGFLILCSALFVFIYTNLNAKVTTQIGGGIGYGFEIETQAIQFGALFDIEIPFQIATDYRHFFITDTKGPFVISWWEINANTHYYLTEERVTNFYILCGLQYAYRTVINDSDNQIVSTAPKYRSDIGFNIGGGVNFDLRGYNIMPEIKFTLGGNQQLFIGISALFDI